jgi:hypothetical protein
MGNEEKVKWDIPARLNARGYEQVDGIHYDSSTISSPVTNDATIRIIMVLMIIYKWSAQLVDVKGAFLCGNFKDAEEIFMEVPEGFEEFMEHMFYCYYCKQYMD